MVRLDAARKPASKYCLVLPLQLLRACSTVGLDDVTEGACRGNAGSISRDPVKSGCTADLYSMGFHTCKVTGTDSTLKIHC